MADASEHPVTGGLLRPGRTAKCCPGIAGASPGTEWEAPLLAECGCLETAVCRDAVAVRSAWTPAWEFSPKLHPRGSVGGLGQKIHPALRLPKAPKVKSGASLKPECRQEVARQ